MHWWVYAICVIAAYLVGSVNFAIVFSRVKKTDIKKVGSGNPGTMNVLRSVGKIWGVLTFICDALKGIIFALIGMYALKSVDWMFILGTVAVLGHIFPIYTKFRGGKGVATSIGVFLVASPIVGGVVFVALILFLLFVKYGFIGSLGCIGSLCIYNIVRNVNSIPAIVCCALILALVIFSHRSNIIRLAKGKENTLNIIGKNQVKKLDEEDKEENTVEQTDKEESVQSEDSLTDKI